MRLQNANGLQKVGLHCVNELNIDKYTLVTGLMSKKKMGAVWYNALVCPVDF